MNPTEQICYQHPFNSSLPQACLFGNPDERQMIDKYCDHYSKYQSGVCQLSSQSPIECYTADVFQDICRYEIAALSPKQPATPNVQLVNAYIFNALQPTMTENLDEIGMARMVSGNLTGMIYPTSSTVPSPTSTPAPSSAKLSQPMMTLPNTNLGTY